MRRTAIALVSLALAAAPLAATPAVAEDAAAAAHPKVIAKNLLSPLSLAVTPKGGVWFSQNFAGVLMRARPGKEAKPVFKARKQGTEVGAVSVRKGVVTFATTSPTGKTALMTRSRDGDVSRVADLFWHESQFNPDGEQTYGFTDLEADCEVPEDFQPYTGIVESHPYASLTRGGTTYVADAAANAILSVTDGAVETVAVLPTQPITVPPGAGAAFGLPECAEGHDFHFEPVPTDVEMGADGMLYVTTLPGGPEDPSLGNRAAVHRIDPATGDLETVVTGLLSATGLAIGDNGDLYVAELFAGRIAVIPAGTSEPQTWRSAMLPGDVEFQDGRVWATRKVLTGLSGKKNDPPKGQVVRYPR